MTQPNTIARVPACAVQGTVADRVRTLCEIARPFADLMPEWVLDWRYEPTEFRLQSSRPDTEERT